MSKPLERVTCTLPRELVKAADSEARRLSRSRSWVVADALRCRLTASIGSPEAAAFEEARRSQRQADLRLTPSERVRAAEELAELAFASRARPRRKQVIIFEGLEDYFDWKRRDVLP